MKVSLQKILTGIYRINPSSWLISDKMLFEPINIGFSPEKFLYWTKKEFLNESFLTGNITLVPPCQLSWMTSPSTVLERTKLDFSLER